nr:hypothetical protein [Tanacetum cinerariifolium]
MRKVRSIDTWRPASGDTQRRVVWIHIEVIYFGYCNGFVGMIKYIGYSRLGDKIRQFHSITLQE